MDAAKKELKEEITHILYDQTRRTPIVIPVINEIAGGVSIKTQGQNGNQVIVDPLQTLGQTTPIKYPPRQVPDSETSIPRIHVHPRTY